MSAPVLTIGGEEVTLAPVSFAKIKQVAPLLDAMRSAATDLEVKDKVLSVLAVFLGRDDAALKDQVLFIETRALLDQWPAVLEWAGLVPPAPSGEAGATTSQPSASTT